MNYPSGFQNAITSVPIGERQRETAKKARGQKQSQRRCYAASLEDGGRGQEPRNARSATLDIGKAKETDFPLEPLGGCGLPNTLISAQ